MAEICKILADNLRRLRNEREITQEELAEKADVSSTSIQGYETGRTWPSVEVIENMAKALRIEDYKLFEKESPPSIQALAKIILEQEIELNSLRPKVKLIQPEILAALQKAPSRKIDMVRAALGLPVLITVPASQKKKT
jgi:transcriptional regulator with XRE-family HTH domain